jgi:hypothetical protein
VCATRAMRLSASAAARIFRGGRAHAPPTVPGSRTDQAGRGGAEGRAARSERTAPAGSPCMNRHLGVSTGMATASQRVLTPMQIDTDTEVCVRVVALQFATASASACVTGFTSLCPRNAAASKSFCFGVASCSNFKPTNGTVTRFRPCTITNLQRDHELFPTAAGV